MLPIPNPIAFTIFGIDIRWYAITMVGGILAGLLFTLSRLKRWQITEDDFLDLFIWLIPLSLVGARLYYVIFEWDYYGAHPAEILAFRNGGLAVHGALIMGLLVTVVFCRVKHYNILKFLDLLVPAVALGQAIGRWGNYFNMEAHGTTTTLPWAIPVISGSAVIRVHPTFLYESLWDLALFFFLVWYQNHKQKYCGQSLCLYFILYSVGRFCVEGLRTDSLMFLGLRQAQLISLGMIALGTVGLFVVRKLDIPFKLLPKNGK